MPDVTCTSCGAENPAGQKFCGECGHPLAAVCSACGAANPPGQRFCGECGAALGSAAAAPAPEPSAASAERRLVSVLFADLVGFTTASEGRDSEDTRELLSSYFDGRNGHLAPVLADYGEWLVACGRAEEAEPLLDEARELFERMSATRWLERIDAVRPKETVVA